MEVRHPLEEERSQVVALVSALLDELGASSLLSLPDGLTALEELMTHPERGSVLVAVEGERLLGVATLSYQWALRTRGWYAILQEMYVKPQARSNGTGAMLLEGASLEAARAGCPQIELATPGDHSPYHGRRAERFYVSHQFRVVGKRLVKVL